MRLFSNILIISIYFKTSKNVFMYKNNQKYLQFYATFMRKVDFGLKVQEINQRNLSEIKIFLMEISVKLENKTFKLVFAIKFKSNSFI